ncbi:hypothetical protein PENSPDRAFT_695558 [Peniophora sp. CONT]|nr:hypothetical protein PENSPDRAFT_695558 [Peniophora sp. CONT]
MQSRARIQQSVRFLTIPKLLTITLGELAVGEVLSAAHVCHAWLDPARSVIWRDVDQHCALWRLAGDVHCPEDPAHEHIMTIPLQQTGIAHFSSIAQHVRTLNFNRGCGAPTRRAFQVLSNYLSAPLFPGLTSLSMGGELILSTITPASLSPSLSGLICCVHTLDNNIQTNYFYAPTLRTLTFYASKDSGDCTRTRASILENLPAVCPRLKHLQLLLYFLTWNMIRAVASTQICQLNFSCLDPPGDNAGDPIDVLSGAPSALMHLPESGNFVRLQRIAVCVQAVHLSALLECHRFPSAQLVRIYLRAVQQEAPEDVRALVETIAMRCTSLVRLALFLSLPVDANPVLWGSATPPRLTFDHLGAITRLADLELLQITHARPLDLNNQDVNNLFRSCRELWVCELNPYPNSPEPVDLTSHTQLHRARSAMMSTDAQTVAVY